MSERKVRWLGEFILIVVGVRRNRVLLAEIKTLREYALRQIYFQTEFMTSAKAVLRALDSRLAAGKRQ